MAAVLAWGSSACALLHRGPVRTRSLELRAAPRVNDDTPVRIYLVVARSNEAARLLGTLSAAKYVAQRDQLRNDFPGAIEAYTWEVVPGQSVVAGRPPFRRRGVRALYVFADYLASGDHRARGDPFKHLVVQLQEHEFSLIERAR